MNDHDRAEQHLEHIAMTGSTRSLNITRCQACGLGTLQHATMREDGETIEILACDHCTFWA